MHTQDNAKVIETLEKHTLCNYFEKLAGAKIHKVALFSVFPLTAAANISDAHYFFLIEDIAKLTTLNSGNTNN